MITPDGEFELKIKKADVLDKGNNKQQLLYNKYGQGTAYLLNYFMDAYPEEKANQNNAASLAKIRNLFEKEYLISALRITTPSGDPENGIEKYAFSHDNSSTRLLGLLPGTNGKNREVLLQLDEVAHMYDIRNEKYLGEGKEFKIDVKNSVPELFGLLPGIINSINVRTSSSLNRGESVTLDFEIVGEEVSTFNSVATIEVYNPDGEKVNYYSKNCDIINGSGSYSFSIAMNDLKGTWKILATEVISGVEKEVSIDIK